MTAVASTYDFACVDFRATLQLNNKFVGAAADPTTGLIFFAPHRASCVGTFNSSTSASACIYPTVDGQNSKFEGAAADPTTGLIVFAPRNAKCVGTFNPSTSVFACIDISATHFNGMFHGAVAHPTTGLIVFAPQTADCVGTFNPSTSVFACSDITATLSHNWKFSGAAADPTTGLIIFAPSNADCVGTFNPSTSEFACVDISATLSIDGKFNGAAVDPTTGLIVFSPNKADCVGTFDASASEFACIDISATLSVDNKFAGAAVDPTTGLIVFAPYSADCVGTFNPSTSAFACIDISATLSGDKKFHGVAVDPTTGLIVFAPRWADCVGTLAIAACDDPSKVAPCNRGRYRTNCGTTATGLVSAAAARSIGSCRSCTIAASDEYFSADGGLVDACPVASCADLGACTGAATRVECGGGNQGYCSACDRSVLPPGSFFNQSAPDPCTPASCAALPNCPLGEYRDRCNAFSAGACKPCTRVPDEYFVGDGGLTDSCPTSRCVDEAACAVGEYRAGCGGVASGFCTPCTAKNATEFFTGDGGLHDACPRATCANLECPAGSVRTGACGNDATRSNDDYACEACRPGTYEGRGACRSCEPGTFQSRSGATACDVCPLGSHCPVGAAVDLPCPAGASSNATGVPSAAYCTLVGAGYWAPLGSALPQPCPASGFYCPGAAYDDVNTPGGSLPIELTAGAASETQQVEAVRQQMTLGIAMDEYNATAVRRELAALYAVPADLIELSAVGGSVQLTVTIRPSSAGAAAALSIDALLAAVDAVDVPTLAASLGGALGTANLTISGVTAAARATVPQVVELPVGPGRWTTAGKTILCPANTYNPLHRQTFATACIACPPNSHTDAEASTRRADCVCDAGHYDANASTAIDAALLAVTTANGAPNSTVAAVVQCEVCPIGTACVGGATLEDLPNRDGFFRASPAAIDVRRCPDHKAGCEAGAAACNGTSGCRADGQCAPGLTGVFCQACDLSNVTDGKLVHYVAATDDEVAHCAPCGTPVGAVLVGSGLALLLAGIVLAFRRGHTASKAWRSWFERSRHAAAAWHFWRANRVANKGKIVLGFYMIAVKVPSVYGVPLPPDLLALFNGFAIPLGFGIDLFTSSLECVHLGGFFLRLCFYAVAPIVLFCVIVCGVALGIGHTARSSSHRALMLKATPPLLRALFLVYPVMSSDTTARGPEHLPSAPPPYTALHRRARARHLCAFSRLALSQLLTTIAFQAFPCHRFDAGTEHESRWLIADPSVPCDSSAEYAAVHTLAWLTIVVYPVGALVVCGALLRLARRGILRGTPSELAQATSFLWHEYKPDFYWWELVEMGRRFLLVGLFVVIQPGSMLQIVLATVVCVLYLLIQTLAAPYATTLDNFLAATTSAMLLVVFQCSIVFKYIALTDEPELQAKMSIEQRADYLPPVRLLSAIVAVSLFGAIAATIALFVVKALEERGAFNRMYQDPTSGLMNRKRFDLTKLELEALAKMGKESKGGEGKFRSRLRSFGAAIRRSSRQVDDETTTRTTVPTFLRVGASTDWERADKCETAVRARIYLAGFGDLQARGGILAHDDPKIAGILKWAATWSLGDAESMQETIKELKANGGVIFISCDIQGFKAVNDNLDHTAGDQALAWYGNIMKAVCAQANGHHKRLLEATPYRTGGDEVAAILQMRRGKATNERCVEFATEALKFVRGLSQIHVEAPCAPWDKRTGEAFAVDFGADVVALPSPAVTSAEPPSSSAAEPGAAATRSPEPAASFETTLTPAPDAAPVLAPESAPAEAPETFSRHIRALFLPTAPPRLSSERRAATKAVTSNGSLSA